MNNKGRKSIAFLTSVLLTLSLLFTVFGTSSCYQGFGDDFGFEEETAQRSEPITNGFSWTFDEELGMVDLSFAKGKYTYSEYSKLDGKKWSFYVNGKEPDAVSFYDADHGTAVFFEDAATGHRMYSIYQTCDGGKTWRNVNYGGTDRGYIITQGDVVALFDISENYTCLISLYSSNGLYYYAFSEDKRFYGCGFIEDPETIDLNNCSVVINLKGHGENSCDLNITLTDTDGYSETVPVTIRFAEKAPIVPV